MSNNVDKKLYRSKKDRIIAGICGGLGEYFNIDPVLVRVVFILLAFANGFGILLYIILMVILPSESEIEHSEAKPLPNMPASSGEKSAMNIFARPEPQPEPGKEINPEIAREPVKSVFSSKRNLIGTVIIIIGLIIFLDNFLPIFSWLSWKMIWALSIIFLGYLIVKN